MIPFHKIYSWLFKSFNISWETILTDRLIAEWYQEIMIIKRSWIFSLFTLWLPIIILILSWISIYIAYSSISIDIIKYTLIGGNILMAMILLISSISYIWHFRSIHHEPQIVTDMVAFKKELLAWDKYFQSFYDWSITNQWILIWIICIELLLVFVYGKQIGGHFWILTLDTLVILIEIWFIRHYRKRMTDLEMDYNVFVPWKIFFINQSWLLSVTQTIEWEKIKSVQSVFPSKMASFFNYGTVNILLEWDSQEMMWTMSMYYVTSPDKVVAYIQYFIEDKIPESRKSKISTIQSINTNSHSLDTREKIRDVLR